MKPMLAHKWNGKNMPFPCFGQFKYNGIRALWLGDEFQSRSYGQEEGLIFAENRLLHIKSELEQLQKRVGSTLMLDGELYCHGMSLQQINARARVKSVNCHKDEGSLKYYIFDVMGYNPFKVRHQIMEKLDEALETSHLRFAPTFILNDEYEANLLYRQAKREDYEGIMLRDPSSPYGFQGDCGNKENRWKYLLKRKDEFEMDAVVLGVKEGKGQHAGKAGAFKLKSIDSGVEFDSGGGLYVNQRQLIWDLKDELVGTRVVVKYDELSDAGKPLRNRIIFIDDERVE